MVNIRTGARIARNAKLRVCCAAAVYNDDGKVLVTQRVDDGRWCLPGGGMDPGESVSEACEREVREETGLIVRVTRLIGIYSSPDVLAEYTDGNTWQSVDLVFGVSMVSGSLQITAETTAARYCSLQEILQLPIHPQDMQRLEDVFAGTSHCVIR